MFVIDGEEFHYFIRNGVLTKSFDKLENHHVGLIASDGHFKDILGDPMSALSNYVKGEYEGKFLDHRHQIKHMYHIGDI